MFYTITRFLRSDYAKRLSSSEIEDLKYLTKVFPFKVSQYVMDELIDWENREDDPMYRLTFPRPDMLSDQHWKLLRQADTLDKERQVVRTIRHQLNPHPAGQTDNIPSIGDRKFGGIQHKYRETVLFFPAQGQTCHSYCTYCFRWAQFVNLDEHKFRSKDHNELFDYLAYHDEVTDILFTGGDPMWMNNEQFSGYLDVIMEPELDHVSSIRIGSKALAFWPQRFIGNEGEGLLRKFESIINSGKNVTLMAHFSNDKELQTKTVEQAVLNLRNAGVTIRTQAPLIRGVNDSADIWRDMWKKQVLMGMVPYYMFIERDTGAYDYFSVPLNDAYHIFTEAYSQVSGLVKTVRGPSMSAWPGKVLVTGISGTGEHKKFILKFIQSRNPQLINKPFFAKFDLTATWLDELDIESPMKEHLDKMAGVFEEDDMEIDEVA